MSDSMSEVIKDVKITGKYLAVAQDQGYHAKVVLASIGPCDVPIYSLLCRYPRFIHSEMLTHRCFARNSASSRAIPLKKMLENVEKDPVIPLRWGSEARGMKTGDEVDVPNRAMAQCEWIAARDTAVGQAKNLAEQGIHKSICNRVVEPFMWMECLITATDWENFFRQRCHEDAEVHMQKIAYLMHDAIQAVYRAQSYQKLHTGSWHLPFVTYYDQEELRNEYFDAVSRADPLVKDINNGVNEFLCFVSTARCARISYLTHDGVQDWCKDLQLWNRLRCGSGFGHWSPTEHVNQAQGFALDTRGERYNITPRSGPMRGYTQFRKTFPAPVENGDA